MPEQVKRPNAWRKVMMMMMMMMMINFQDGLSDFYHPKLT